MISRQIPSTASHGVNIAEGQTNACAAAYVYNKDHLTALKSEALSYRFTHDESDVQSTFDRLNLLYTYHGRESGGLFTRPD
jgi:hypothetical protein